MPVIELPPGVVNQKSLRSNQANWREVNLVRWEDGGLAPIGGWEALEYPVFASPLRNVHRWVDNYGNLNTAFLCELHCYVDNGAGDFYDITPADGITGNVPGVGGWGDGDYGTGDFGTPRDVVVRTMAATPAYTLDNWGYELRAMVSTDGRLLRWNPATSATPLVAVANAPVNNHSFAVTPERHIILFGADGEPQQFVWSDQENDTVWTVSTTSKAGGYFVEPAAPIVAHEKTPSGMLMFTNQANYIIQYVGLPFIYSYELVSESPPPYSPLSVAAIPEGAFWAATNGFWIFDGVSARPVDCPLWTWIDERINLTMSRYRASMIHVPSKFEVWWSFVSGDESTENNLVVIYNYKMKAWSMGRVGRSCGYSAANDQYPLMATEDEVFRHESGWEYPGADGMPWAETFTLNTARGAIKTTVHQMLPEVSGGSDAIVFKFYKRNNPSGNSEVLSLPKPIRSNGYVDVRETARDFRMRVEMVKHKDWSIGVIDMDTKARGKK